MSPLGNWPVIPDGWVEHHRPVVEGTLTGVVELRRPSGPPPFPKPEGWVAYDVLWTGMCRLQELKRENGPLPAMQPTELRQYLLVLPFHNAAGEPLPELRIGENADTAHVAGRDLMLKQSMGGTLLWEQDFIVWENQTQHNP